MDCTFLAILRRHRSNWMQMFGTMACGKVRRNAVVPVGLARRTVISFAACLKKSEKLMAAAFT